MNNARMANEGPKRSYVARLRRDPRLKAIFDGFISQALVEADQRYPDPYMDRERTLYATRRSTELAMAFVLDNDAEYQMIYEQWEKAVENAVNFAHATPIKIELLASSRDEIIGKATAEPKEQQG